MDLLSLQLSAKNLSYWSVSGSRWSAVLCLQYREKEGLEEMIFPLQDLKALQKYNMFIH